MKSGRRLLRVATPLVAGSVLLSVFACTGGDTSIDTTNGGRILSECEYAEEVSARLAIFAASTLSVTQAGAGANLTQAIDRLDTELASIARELGALKSTQEVNEVNQSLVSGVDELRRQLPEAKRAAEAGDLAGVETAMDKAIKDFGAKVEQSEKDHAEVSGRLTQCGP